MGFVILVRFIKIFDAVPFEPVSNGTEITDEMDVFLW
jgi:hypothetical protein